MSENKTIRVHSDLIQAAFKLKKIDVYSIWLFIKGIDKEKNNATGCFPKELFIQYLSIVFGLSRSSIYRILSEGESFFWENKNDKIFLYGSKKLCSVFDLKNIQKKIFLLPIGLLACDKTSRRSLLFSMFVASRSEPQSYEAISKNCGISKNSAIEYIKKCELLNKKTNFSPVSFEKTIDEANGKVQTISKKFNLNKDKFFIASDGKGNIVVLFRMPNSYSIAMTECPRSKKRLNKKILNEKPGIAVDIFGNEIKRNRKYIEGKKKHIKTIPTEDGHYEFVDVFSLNPIKNNEVISNKTISTRLWKGVVRDV